MEPEPVPPSQRLPACLLRTLRQSGGIGGPAGVLLLAAHAALLETGFVPCWAEGGGNGGSAYQLPPSCWVSASVWRARYRLVPAGGDGNGNGSGSRGGEEGGMEVEAAEQQGAEQRGEQGAQEEAGAGPVCTLQCSTLGAGAAVLAVSTRAHTRHLALQAGEYVQPQPASAAAAEAGPSSSGGSTGPSSAAEGAGAAVHLLPDGGLALGGGLALAPAGAKALWTRLKDGLAFPMLLACYAEAGLAPPAGLLALPEELKGRVLQALGVRWGRGRAAWVGGRMAEQGWRLACLVETAELEGHLHPEHLPQPRFLRPSLLPLPSRSHTTWPRCRAAAPSCATWRAPTRCGARSSTASSRQQARCTLRRWVAGWPGGRSLPLAWCDSRPACCLQAEQGGPRCWPAQGCHQARA